jgi:hypothetical protein
MKTPLSVETSLEEVTVRPNWFAVLPPGMIGVVGLVCLVLAPHRGTG